jgi:peptidoglycan/xylan/chitin deacetylase (PgdA/CDA1 family)
MGAYTLPQNITGVPAVMIGFDDANLSTYDVAYQYMQPRNIPGTFYVRTGIVNNPNRVTSSQLLTLHRDGWTIGNHTRNHIDLTGLALAAIEAELNGGKDDLQGWGITGNGPFHARYPFGTYDADVLTAMANTSMLTGRAAMGVDYPTLPFANAYTIGSSLYLSYGNTTLAEAKTWVDGVKANNRLGITTMHDIADDPDNAYEWGTADFYAFIDYIVQQQVPVITMDEAYRLQSGPVLVRTGDIMHLRGRMTAQKLHGRGGVFSPY